MSQQQYVSRNTNLQVIKSPGRNQWGVIMYGQNNSYPQQLLVSVAESAAAMSAWAMAHRFLKGVIKEEYYTIKVNRWGLTIADVIDHATRAASLFSGYSTHTGYNGGGVVSEITPIPFTFNRFKAPDEDFERPTLVGVWSNWCGENPNPNGRRSPVFIPVFDFENAGRDLEIAASKKGGIEKNWWGQLHYATMATASDGIYPTAVCHGAKYDIVTDGGISETRMNFVQNGMWQSGIITTEGGASTETQDAVDKFMGEQMGPRSGGGLLYLPNTLGLKMIPMNRQDDDKFFLETSINVADRIRQSFWNIPVALFGDKQAGSLGNSTELETGFHLYNSNTADARAWVQRTLNQVFANSVFGEIELQPLKWEDFYGNVSNNTSTSQPV